MPPKKNKEQAAPSGHPTPTASETDFLLSLIDHMEGVPPINWDSLAAQKGYSNGMVAKKRFYNIKKRLGIMGGSNASKGSVTAVTDAGVAKRKRAPKQPTASDKKAKSAAIIKSEDENDEDEDEASTPGYDRLRPSVKHATVYDGDVESQLRFEAGGA